MQKSQHMQKHKKGEVMSKKIVFNQTEIIVSECYAYRYESGKEVLRISSTETKFEVLKTLEGYDGSIQYYEEDEMKIEYSNYSADFSCNYIDGSFTIEMVKTSSLEMAVQKNQEDIKLTADALDQLLVLFYGGLENGK